MKKTRHKIIGIMMVAAIGISSSMPTLAQENRIDGKVRNEDISEKWESGR